MTDRKLTEAEAVAALGGEPDPEQSTDVATITDDVDDYREVSEAELEKYVENISTLVVEDPDAIALRIAQRRLMAKTVEELLTPQTVIGAREVLGIPLRVTEVHFNRSTFEGGVQVYAIFDAINEQTGERGTYSCGAADVLVQLYKLVEFGALPITVQIVQSMRPSAGGFFPLHLEAVRPPEPSF